MASLVASVGAQVPGSTAARRDLLLAAASVTQPGDFEVTHWTSSGPTNAFVARRAVVTAAGTATHIDRSDATGGDYFVAADLAPTGLGGSIIYSFVSPFTRTVRSNHLPLRAQYGVGSPDLIADFEYEPPNADPTRSMSFVVVGRNVATGANWLRRVSFAGAAVAEFVFGSGAQHLTLAVDPARGDIHVVDDRGMLHTFTSALVLTSYNLLTPVVSCHDLVWHEPSAGRGRLLASGHSSTLAGHALFALVPGMAPSATVETLMPGPTGLLAVDAQDDGYCFVDAAAGGREVWLWDDKTGLLERTNIPVAAYQSLAWTSRCTVEMIASSPGTPVRTTLVPPRVGDAGLTFSVSAPPGVTLEPIGILFSSRWTDQAFGLGTNSRLLVDPGAAGFVFLPLPGAQPPTVLVPRRLLGAYDGVRGVAQMLWMDASTKEWLASWAANFVIGQ